MSPVNMPREPSTDATAHRELVVVDPPMLGADVKALQVAVKARLKARGLADDVPLATHGKFTHATWLACVEAGYSLGLDSATYLKTNKKRGVCTIGAQRIYRDPKTRTAVQLGRARARADRVKDGPRYYDQLAKTIAKPAGKGVKAALAFAKANIGVHETPAGSNWGGKVGDWIRLAGYTGPVPWCGCFVNACLVAAGIPNGKGWIGYTPAIIAHARAGTGGWSWHSEGEPGDLVLFDTPGGDPAVHVGIVVKRIAKDHYLTREGNTSSGAGGSQDNGGTVAERDRRSVPAFRIAGFARPPW